jgi:hypothetical protein
MATDNSQALDLLDMDFEAIEDVPGFEVPHNGDYRLRLGAEVKKIKENQCLEISYEVMDTLKKNNDADPDAVPGTKFSQLFSLQGEPEKVKKALGYAKLLLKPIGEAVGEGNLMVLVRDHLPGMICTATVKRRADKEDDEKFYPVIKNLMKE